MSPSLHVQVSEIIEFIAEGAVQVTPWPTGLVLRMPADLQLSRRGVHILYYLSTNGAAG